LMMQDDVADDLVVWMAATKDGRQQFDTVLENGVPEGVTLPGPLARFFAAVERRPDWADPAVLTKGGEAHLRLFSYGGVASGALGLVAGYRNGAAIKPLVTTGSLTEATGKRLSETVKFSVDVIDSNGMGRFSDGFKSAVRVRLVHGFVRRGLTRSPKWRADLWGPPIPMVDSLGTAFQFWVPLILALPKFGYDISREEREGMMMLWNYVGYIQGVPDELLPRTLEETYHLNCAIMMVIGQPDEDTKALSRAFLDAAEGSGDDRSWLRRKMIQGAIALLLPEGHLAEVGIEDTPFKVWPLLFRPLVRRQEKKRLRNPALHAQLIAKGREAAYASLPESIRHKAHFDPSTIIHDQSGLAA
jgi:hypothetical protein